MLHLDTGNTGFMILCTSLVMLMTPGLAFFYGGLVGRKNVLAIMIQSFVSMGWTTVIWYLYGYSLCFSGDWHGIIGNLNNFCLRGIDLTTPSPNNTIPMMVFIAYQMMFAIITPALISGAFTNRVSFKAYCLFLTGWLTFVYFPFVHMVWGGGILQQWGVLDFAGGIVVHNIAGLAALASVLYVGKRRILDRGPHSIPLVALGTGLLWFGWYGFNAGSEMRGDSGTATAFLNTDIAASFAAVAWVGGGLVPGEKTQVPRTAHGRGRRARDHHSRGGLCFAHHGRHHWSGVRRGLLLRGRNEEPSALGRRARCLGRTRSRWLPRHRYAGTVRQQSVQPRRWDERSALWQSVVLRETTSRGALLVRMGIRLHLRHAVRH